jgi:membrane protease YdiL (CAAX protease family)
LFFGFGLILLLIRWRPSGSLRTALRPESWGWNIGAIVSTVIVRIFLNNVGAWPFRWRWNDDNTRVVQMFFNNGQGAAHVFFLLAHAIAPAVIEEVVFRFGLLQVLKQWTGSGALAVIVSAILFGAMHLGYFPWAPGEATEYTWNSIAAASLGLVLGALALRRGGRISGPIVIHATVNLVDMATLLSAAI